MVKFILMAFVVSFSARADLFDFGADRSQDSKIPAMTEKLKNLEMKDGPEFEEVFNQSIKGLENAVEQERLYCAGEAVNAKGKTLPPAKKPLCMRELKKQYLEAMKVIFEQKKKYLSFIHQRQLKKLDEIQSKLRSDIEKNF